LAEASRSASRPLLTFDGDADQQLWQLVQSQLQLSADDRDKSLDIFWEF
jgi:hypothetical protein